MQAFSRLRMDRLDDNKLHKGLLQRAGYRGKGISHFNIWVLTLF